MPFVLSWLTCSRVSSVSCPMSIGPHMLRSIRALVAQVLSCPTCLVSYVISCLKCLVPYLKCRAYSLIYFLSLFKGATKLKPKIIFVSTKKIGESTINIINCCFLRSICTLSHQTKYIHIENEMCFSQTVFIWSS